MKKYLLFVILFVLTLGTSFSQDDDEPIIKNFTIDEVEIEFKNQNSFSKNEILNIIKTGNSDLFNQEEFVLDMQRIEKFYFDNGYIDAFIDTSSTINQNKRRNIRKIFYFRK